MTQNRSLFDAPSIWLTDPLEAFRALIGSDGYTVDQQGRPRTLRASSVKIYTLRFGKFVRWLDAVPATLANLDSGQLAGFLAGMSPASRWRYVQILERVFDHLAQFDVRQDNPARALAIKAPVRSAQGHVPTLTLNEDQQEAFIAALPAGAGWRPTRAAALLMLIMGSGIKVREAISCNVDQIGRTEDDGTLILRIPKLGAGKAHETRLQPFAVPLILKWLARRQVKNCPGNLLFPHEKTGAPLHPATVYRAMAAVMAQAGIPADQVPRRGARTLRNTWAADALHKGGPVALVGQQLGHYCDRSTRRYQGLSRKQPRAAQTGTTPLLIKNEI